MPGHGRWNRERSVVISIRPEWTKKIFTGLKKAELRKDSPQLIRYPFTAYVYETKPGAGGIIGEMLISGVDITKDVDKLSEMANVPIQKVQAYLDGAPGYLWIIDNFIRYDKPVEIDAFDLERAPQSWQYVSAR